MKSALIFLLLAFLSGCVSQRNNGNLSAKIEGFYDIKNLIVNDEVILDSTENVFRVIALSDTEARLLMLFYSNNKPNLATGRDQLKRKGKRIVAYYNGQKVATFWPDGTVKYRQGKTYIFDGYKKAIGQKIVVR